MSSAWYIRAVVVAALSVALLVPATVDARPHASRQTKSVARSAAGLVTTTVTARYRPRRRVLKGRVGFQALGISPDESLCVSDRRVLLVKVKNARGERVNKVVDRRQSGGDGFFGWKFATKKVARGTWTVKVRPGSFADSYGDLVECSRAKLQNNILID